MDYEEYSIPELKEIKSEFERELSVQPEENFVAIGYYKSRIEIIGRILKERILKGPNDQQEEPRYA